MYYLSRFLKFEKLIQLQIIEFRMELFRKDSFK